MFRKNKNKNQNVQSSESSTPDEQNSDIGVKLQGLDIPNSDAEAAGSSKDEEQMRDKAGDVFVARASTASPWGS